MKRSSDGFVEFKILDNQMKVSAVFHPPIGDGQPLSNDYVIKLLQDSDIIFGIKEDLISDLCFKTNTEHKLIEDAIIAEGEAPKKEIPAHLKLKKRFFEQHMELEETGGRVDYKQASPYQIVRKGEVIARVIDKREGTPGTDVKGNTVKHDTEKIIQFQPGENLEVKEGNVLATTDGRFVLEKTVLNIHEILTIKGDVDYHTGNIVFPGDVYINGEVKDGFIIKSGGSIICTQTLDASQVICKKDIIAKQGIIGKKPGFIRALGDITAHFIQNCWLELKGALHVEKAILNTQAYCIGRPVFGNNIKIVGGSLHSLHGFTAHQIGHPSGMSTRLVIGIDFVTERRLRVSREKDSEIQSEINSIDRLIESGKIPQDSLLEQKKKRSKLVEESNKLRTLIAKLEGKYYNTEKTELNITGSIHRGCEIQIGKATQFFEKDHRPCKLSYNPNTESLEIQ